MTLKMKMKSFFVSIITLTFFTNSVVIAKEFDALLTWSKRVELSTPVNGVVQTVFASPGNIVAKGDILIQLDPRIFKADLKSAKARYKNSNAQTEEAKRELDRQTDMYDRTMLSDHDLQVTKNNFTSAQSEYYQAQSSLTKAKLNLEYSAIRAPFNSVIIDVAAVKGQVVASEVTPPILVIVAEAQRMLARFYATNDTVSNLALNQGVNVKVAGQSYQGKVINIALEPGKLKSEFYAVDVIFDSKDKLLRAGQKAKIKM